MKWAALLVMASCSSPIVGTDPDVVPPSVWHHDLSCGMDLGPTGFDGPPCTQTGPDEYLCPVDYEGDTTNLPHPPAGVWWICTDQTNTPAPHCWIYEVCK